MLGVGCPSTAVDRVRFRNRSAAAGDHWCRCRRQRFERDGAASPLPTQPPPSPGRKQIRFPQFVGLAYVILQGTDFLKRPPLRQYRYTEQMFLGHLREAFIVLEADFASLDQGRGYVPLEVFMLPSAHRFEWISAADRSHDWIKVVRCDGCMAPDPVWRCPHPNCYVYVCHSCWEQGMKSHTIPAGGAGTRLHCEAVQEMTRAVFARVDHTESGNLDFFDFLTLSFLMIRLGFEYQVSPLYLRAVSFRLSSLPCSVAPQRTLL